MWCRRASIPSSCTAAVAILRRRIYVVLMAGRDPMRYFAWRQGRQPRALRVVEEMLSTPRLEVHLAAPRRRPVLPIDIGLSSLSAAVGREGSAGVSATGGRARTVGEILPGSDRLFEVTMSLTSPTGTTTGFCCRSARRCGRPPHLPQPAAGRDKASRCTPGSVTRFFEQTLLGKNVFATRHPPSRTTTGSSPPPEPPVLPPFEGHGSDGSPKPASSAPHDRRLQ